MPGMLRAAGGVSGKLLRTSAALVISAALLWLSLRTVDRQELVSTLRSSSLSWIAASALLYSLEMCIRGVRWRTLLRPVARLSMLQVMLSLVIGYAANNALPARLGELVRADFVGWRYGISRYSAIATIVVERLLDVLAVVGCAGVGLVTIASERGSFELSEPAANIAYGLLVVGVIAVAAVGVLYFVAAYATLAERLASSALRWAFGAIEVGLRAIHRPREVTVLIALSALVWICNGMAMWAMLRAVGIDPSTATVVLVLGVAGVAAAIPAAPANIGTLQFAFALALGTAGHSSTAAFAAATLVQCVLLGGMTLFGAILYGGVVLSRGRILARSRAALASWVSPR